MFTVISLILIAIALAVSLVIIIKKFPALAILDVANIPGEKETKFKQQIIKQRVNRDLARWSGRLGRLALTINRRFSNWLKSWQMHLKKIKANHETGTKIPWQKKQKQIQGLLLAAEDLIKKEIFDSAEEKLVEVISLDQKNLPAFLSLGSLYESQKKWLEARQTYEHILKLERQYRDDKEIIGDLTRQEIYFSLANIEREAGETEAALENIREALELEPNNPRYLDLILNLSIMRKDKALAEEYWDKLAAVNPDNNKLTEWWKEIENL
jgi:tetratricopeptide (TPR) repeat protein